MKIIGLTGSIGMGKTTTAAMFRALGVPVQDADAVVHGLFQSDPGVVARVDDAFPGVAVDGRIDRAALGKRVFGNPVETGRLEAIVHPAVRRERERFLRRCMRRGAPVCVLDIPLLFETGAEAGCDVTIVAIAPAFVQAARVLKRPGMTPARLSAIRARQMPDTEKRRRATLVVRTGNGRRPVLRAVMRLLNELKYRR